MRDKIEININLLCHICLDSDTKGRFGVQGNIFSNTFGYLNDYLSHDQNLPPHLIKFQSIMSKLVESEQAILGIRNRGNEDLTHFANKIKNDIMQTMNSNQEMNIMLPGGWRNPEGGHAMIYQFQKTKDGKLRLSIYNAGAGVNKHEQTSFITTERYYPVKAYDIKLPFNEDELSNLIATLVIPQLPPSHPTRKNETYDEDKLYNNIARVLPYLKAEPVLATEFLDEKVTTAGQISGTCSQRSIHQLLKINFNDLPNYQRFILDFKMHALHNFINTHPEPRAKQIANLLKKICINNLKIIMQPGVFNDELLADKVQKKQLIEDLALLKKQVTADEAIKQTEKKQLNSTKSYSYTIYTPSITSINESTQTITKTTNTTSDPLPVLTPINLLLQLEQLIKSANDQKAQNPHWVFEQIEQAICTLPLPTKPIHHDKPISSTNTYESIPFYQTIKTTDDYNQMEKYIEQLQKLYMEAYTELLEKTQLPNLIATQMSFLALRDYFNVRNPNQLETASFHAPINSSLGSFASTMNACPYAATNNTELDQRVVQIADLYQRETISNLHLRKLYKEIIDTEPALRNELEINYQQLYGPNNSPLHQLVRAEGLNAVFYLFQQIDHTGNLNSTTKLNKVKFKPLLDKIIKQLSLEHFFCHCFDSLLSYDPYVRNELKLEEYTSEARLEITTPASKTNVPFMQISTDATSLPNHKYNITKPSSVRQALIADTQLERCYKGAPTKKTGNNIQLSSHDEQSDIDKKNKEPITRIINHEDFFKRELFHLRSTRSNQVNLTLDYFKANLDKLTDQMLQRYMEANIFEPALLQNAFNNDQNLILRFDELIQKGMHRFKNKEGLTSQESIFFIRLRFLFNRYLKQTARLEHDMQHISALIVVNTDPAILASLHQYRFLTAMTLYKQKPDIPNNTLFAEAIQSNFYIQAKSNPYIENDTATRFEIERAQHQFKSWVNKIIPATIQAQIASFTTQLGLDTSNLVPVLTANKQIYNLLNPTTKAIVYSVNVESGHVFKDQKKYSIIPLSIQSHSIMARLGLEQESSCFAWSDNKTFEFITPTQHVRMIKTIQGLTIQKKWTINGQTNWYELRPLTQSQSYAFKLNAAILNHQLPANLTDNRIQAWVGVSKPGELFLTEDFQPKFFKKANRPLECLNEQAQTTDTCIISSHARQQELIQFEGTDFITITGDNNTQQTGHIDFTRYGLTLELTELHIKLPQTDYNLEADTKSPFASNVACLNFAKTETDPETKTETKRRQCIVAVQPFYVNHSAQTADGDYFGLQHDTNNTVARTQLEKHWNEKIIMPLRDQPLWDFKQSAKYITYSLVNASPKPDNAADALYLCYLYLSTNETEKAWVVLDDLRKSSGLTGDPQELTYLAWIINKLPVVLEDKDKNAVLETPEYTACQLKALALLTDFIEQGKQYHLPNLNQCDLSTANGHYEAISLKETQQFYNQLPKKIHSIYSQALKLERHFDKEFTLLDSECLSLLNHMRPDNVAQPLGALGYEWRRLSLKSLLKIYNRLRTLKETTDHFPKALNQRLIEIETQLNIHLPVMKQSTKLELSSVNLTLPEDCKVNLNLMTDPQTLEAFQVWRYDLKKQVANTSKVTEDLAINALKSSIDELHFFQYFPQYVKIAQTKNHPKRQQLIEFCEAYLKGCCHIPLSKQSSNIPLLTNLLYRLIDRPNVYADSLFGIIYSLQKSTPPPIQVLQTKNIFKDELSKSKDIWALLEKELPPPTPLKTQPLIDDENPMEILISKCPQLKPFCEKYRAIETQYQQELKTLLASIQKTSQPDIVHQAELKAGALLYDCTQQQREWAEKNLASQPERNQLLTNALENQESLEALLKHKWDDIFNLANTKPTDSKIAERILVEQLAELRGEITEQDLYKLYFNADEFAYREKTLLSSEKIHELHALMHEFISLKVQKQQVMRLIKALNDAQEKPNDKANLHQIANVLLSENPANAKTDPAFMLFQLEEDILLRPRQVQALKNLLSPSPDDSYKYKESVEKIIMGGGKSKVILPLLAQKKATGLNLVVIEVPRALLSTNHADLNSTSQRLFNQKANRFEFDRDSDCSPERLEKIYHQFNEIIAHQDYLVTTGESMQSLELKYLELTLTKPENEELQAHWKKQVYWASKIVSLVKNQGDVVIDELHQGLLLKKKLNYTLGDQQSIHPELIQHSVKLYLFLDTLAEELSENSTLKSRIKNQWQSIVGKQPQNDHASQLAQALIDDSRSPLHPIIEKLTALYGDANVAEEIRAYLTNQHESEKINSASATVRDTLAFYKEQLSLLPQTLSRHHKEHYGPSKLKNLSAIKRTLSIPYSANDKPNERSRFGNPLETINYTIQSLLSDGLNPELLIEIIEQWQTEAKQDLQKNITKYKNIDETPIALGIKDDLPYFNGKQLTLQQLDVRNDKQMQAVYERLTHNKSLILNLLQDQILKQITTEPAILHSDPYNHVDIYRSAQGLSGTPWNHTTYHQRLQFNRKTSLGTDGYIQTVLQHKKTPLHVANFNPTVKTPITQFLTTIFREKIKTPKQIRAIIDISATFAGVSNIQVAQELAQFIKQQNNAIKYILYFNENDILCALDINKPQLPIILTTSDPKEIDRKLGCKPNERFTYYDQAHTIGADLKQAPQSCGIVLANEKTHLQHFLQGCMRMRGLNEHQTVEIVVPDTLKDQATLDKLLKLMASNENEQLSQDNFIATLAKMENIIRQKFLQQLDSLDAEDVETRHQWAQAFQSYFIETQQYRLFEQYGSINRLEKTSTLLKNHQEKLTKDWITCLTNLNNPPTASDTEELTQTMAAIIEQAIPLCKENYISRSNKGKQDLEVEAQKEKEIMKEMEKSQEEERFDPNLKEVAHIPWVSIKTFHPLNEYCNKSQSKSPFSPELKLSPNYANVYYGQQKMLGWYLKPVHAIWFTKEGDKLTACIVSNQEAEEIKQLTLNNPNHPRLKNGWLSTTQHTPLAGIQPVDILLDPTYQSLIEQVRFFNGECNLLVEQTTPFLWLKQQTSEKLRYFEHNILPYRETKPGAYMLLQAALSSKSMGFEYIQDHPYDDLSEFDWKASFPDALTSDIAAFITLAQAFSDANQRIQAQTIMVDQFKNNYLLPPTAKPYLEKHLKLLNAFRTMLNSIQNTSANALQLDTLNELDKHTLKQVLNIDINTYIQNHRIHATTSLDNVSRNLVNLDILFALTQSKLIDNKSKLIQLIQKNPLMGVNAPANITQDNVLVAILKNTSPDITAKHFEQLLSYPQTKNTLIEQCKHRHLSVDNIGNIVQQAEDVDSMLVYVALNSHHNPGEIASLIATGISHYSLKKPASINAIAQKHLIDTKNYLKLLEDVEGYSSSADKALALLITDTLVEQPFFKPILIQLLRKTSIPANTFKALLTAQTIQSVEILDWLIKIANTEERINALVGAKSTLSSMQLIQLINRSTKAVATIQTIINHANADEKVLDHILNLSNCDDTMYQYMLARPTLPSETLQQLFNKTQNNDAMFKTIVQHPSFKTVQTWILAKKNTFSAERMILCMHHSNPPLTGEQYAEILTDSPAQWEDKVLDSLLSSTTINDAVLGNVLSDASTNSSRILDKVLQRSNLSNNLLTIIISKTTKAATFDKILTFIPCDKQSGAIVDGALLKALILNKDLPQARLLNLIKQNPISYELFEVAISRYQPSQNPPAHLYEDFIKNATNDHLIAFVQGPHYNEKRYAKSILKKSTLNAALIKLVTLKNTELFKLFLENLEDDEQLAKYITEGLYDIAFFDKILNKIGVKDDSAQTIKYKKTIEALLINPDVNDDEKLQLFSKLSLSKPIKINALKKYANYREKVLMAFLPQPESPDEPLLNALLSTQTKLTKPILTKIAELSTELETFKKIIGLTTHDNVRKIILLKDKVSVELIHKITITNDQASSLFEEFIAERTDEQLANLIDKQLFNKAYLESLIKRNSNNPTPKTLQSLLTNINIDEPTKIRIIKECKPSPEIQIYVLTEGQTLTQNILNACLALNNLFEPLLKHLTQKDQKTLQALLINQTLTDQQKIQFLEKVTLDEKNTLTLLTTYTSLTPAVLNKLLLLHTDSDDIKKAILNQTLVTVELIKAVTIGARDRTTLEKVMKHGKTDSTVITAVIDNKHADDALYLEIFHHKAFTAEHAEELVKKPTLTDNLFKKLISACKSASDLLKSILKKTKGTNPTIYNLAEQKQLALASDDYAHALQILKDSLKHHNNDKSNENPRLRYFVKKIKQEIIKQRKIIDKSDQPINKKLPFINKFTTILNHLITTIENESNAIHHPEQAFYDELGKKLLRSSTCKKLGRLLLALGGFLLIGASIAVGLLMGGVLAPISLYGIALGTALIGVAVTGGVSALTGTGLLFWSNRQTTDALVAGYNKVQEVKSSP